jgi:hypothetical protein
MSSLKSIKKDPEIFSRVHTRFSGINKLKPIQLQEIFLLPKVELIKIFLLLVNKLILIISGDRVTIIVKPP